MITFKEVLCLLAIFIAYGIAGHLDYEDALRLERIRQERLYADGPAARPAEREIPVRTTDPLFGPPAGSVAEGSHEVGEPCVRSGP